MVNETQGTESDAPSAGAVVEPSFWRALRGALFGPGALFAESRGLAALAAPVRFAAGIELIRWLVVVAFASALTLLLRGSELFPAKSPDDLLKVAATFAPNVIGYPLLAVAGAFAKAWVVQGVAALSGGRPSYPASVRIAAYASAPAILVGLLAAGVSMSRGWTAWVPAFVALVWGSWVVAQGVTVLHGARRARAFPIALVALACVWVVNAKAVAPLVYAVRKALLRA